MNEKQERLSSSVLDYIAPNWDSCQRQWYQENEFFPSFIDISVVLKKLRKMVIRDWRNENVKGFTGNLTMCLWTKHLTTTLNDVDDDNNFTMIKNNNEAKIE